MNRYAPIWSLLFALPLALASCQGDGSREGATDEARRSATGEQAAETSGGSSVAPAGMTGTARGEFLVHVLGCHHCHTPMQMGPNGPEPVPGRLLSGHPAEMTAPPPSLPPGPWMAVTTMTAWHGPWGTTYATNLTPDEETGMGIWTEETFLKTFETGLHMGVGRPVMPPMPIVDYAKLPAEDLKAIFAYLQSLPPVRNAVPEAVLNEPPAGGGGAPGSAPSSGESHGS